MQNYVIINLKLFIKLLQNDEFGGSVLQSSNYCVFFVYPDALQIWCSCYK